MEKVCIPIAYLAVFIMVWPGKTLLTDTTIDFFQLWEIVRVQVFFAVGINMILDMLHKHSSKQICNVTLKWNLSITRFIELNFLVKSFFSERTYKIFYKFTMILYFTLTGFVLYFLRWHISSYITVWRFFSTLLGRPFIHSSIMANT